MKSKKLISILALVLGASILTACSDAGKKTAFSGYWYQNAATPEVGVQRTDETLVYDVSFTAGSGLKSAGYELDYNGEYTTTLSIQTVEGKTVYHYDTKLAVNVTYIYQGKTETKQDEVTSHVEFETATNGLRPIRSEKTIKNHSPKNSASSLESCYSVVNYTVTTEYNSSASGGSCTVVNLDAKENGSKKSSFSVKDEYTCLDNEQLFFALRGVNPSVSSSPSFSVYDAFKRSVLTVKASYGSKVEGKEFKFNKYNAAESAFKENKANIDYYPVSVAIDADMPGTTQTVWVAATKNSQSNDNRNVILRMENPLYYSLGTLTYTLKSAQFSN